jgi:16S rRNA processing protein RimM
VRVHLHNADSDTLFNVDQVWLNDVAFTVVKARTATKGGVLLVLEGVNDRNRADELRGSTVAVPRDAIAMEEGEVLAADFIGCKAVLTDGTPWGEVVDVIPGAQDRLLIRDGAVERELPLEPELVLEIDLDERIVTVDPPEGLDEVNS